MIESTIYYPAETTLNLYHVPRGQWKRWNARARKMFNHLYGTSVENKPVISGTDMFGESRQTRKVLNAAMWNIAWEGANYVNN